MASSSQRMVHQDYIARIRYSNALPPPPIPPKLLDMPNAGLASGQYTTPGFASRLAREQPLNIEADAELGMPLDLVGMPGIFDGDESSIQAPAEAPVPHPRDRALLRPLTALGRPKPSDAAVSFLRRTEYISSQTPKRLTSANPRALLGKPNPNHKRPAPEPDKDSPAAIRRKIDNSFAAAARILKDPHKVKHPNLSKRGVKLLDATPLLPDVDAFPDSGAYVTIKFQHNPVPSSSTYDLRLPSGLLRPIDRLPAEEAAFQAALQAHSMDPGNHAKPSNLMNYDFYLASSPAAAANLRDKLDVENPARNEAALYTHGNGDEACFQFSRVRAYETAHEVEMDHGTKYDDEIIISFEDAGAAFRYYPVMQRSTIRSQRNKNIARKIGLSADVNEQIIDGLEVTVEEPPEVMAEQMRWYRARPIHPFPDRYGYGDGDGDGDGDGNNDASADEHKERGDPGAVDERDDGTAKEGRNEEDGEEDGGEKERLELSREPSREPVRSGTSSVSVDQDAEGDED